MKRMTWIKILGSMLLAAVVLPLLGHALLLPLIARDRINAVLRDAGFKNVGFSLSRASLWGIEVRDLTLDQSRVSRVLIEYAPQSLWESRLKSINVTGAELVIDPAFRLASSTKSSEEAPFQLPLDRIDISESMVNVNGIRMPFEVHLVSDPNQPYEFKATFVTEGTPLQLSSTFDRAVNQIHGSAQSDAVDAQTVATVLAMFWPKASVSAEGTIALNGHFSWSKDQTSFGATLEPADIWLTLPGPKDANLGWHGGVLEVEGTVRGPSTAVTITMDELEFESDSADLEIEGLTGEIALASLSPIATDEIQHLTMNRLRKGDAIFRDGTIDFAIEQPTQLFIQKTQWEWLEGTLDAEEVRFDPKTSAFEMTVQATGVELKNILELMAEDYAKGEGKIDLRLPVKVSGSRIFFGDGIVTGVGGGTIEILDVDAVADSLGTPDDAQNANVRNKIVEALGDFEYDILTGTLVPVADRGLMTNLHLKGRGKVGAKQALNFELHVDGLDEALLLYLGLQSRFAAN